MLSYGTSVFLEETELENGCLCGLLNGTVRNTNGSLGISIYVDFSISVSWSPASFPKLSTLLCSLCGNFCFNLDC